MAVEGTIMELSNLIVMAEFAAKPLPWLAGINTIDPACPDDGYMNTCGMTVMDWLDVCAAASLALMTCAPEADRSTSIIPTNPPVESVWMLYGEAASVAPVWLNTVPSYDIVIAEFGAKLLPETLTPVPTFPKLVLSEMYVVVDVVTVNCADAELADASVALTVCDPAADVDGIVID